ncbi:DUF4126 domain-containing protein [Thermoflexus sp.]|uniref:DUF4126 domain-containing protein n=1 Tax=Thermoflexus sp. TaxID=1969742 RepID=UPI0025CBC2A6|nr:DUF4126 domain-containing protein [Thermoflexus sp.]MDW8180580.1 DUF4126 domain-containing protein [Anaerolineae bacterium]MCS6964194.1 DUF4126 domain-containing protein [Thermoflexus sp.]MCS7351127.1 DUF4126 domain-containing protein [Thermoflexus sp.]MCX7689898.1 DUF4126 domain-containing protein [Thermoflexus sp.]MDW8185041.1 DUF4126 domain-containing protein [Anaerolineae bacterium]
MIGTILSAFGLAAAAGLNAYIPLLVVALLARFTDWLRLAPPYDTLTHPALIGLLILLALIEFFADKIPAVDAVNDGLQTFVRPAAGAILFGAQTGAIEEIHPVLAMACGLLVAGGVHGLKAVLRRGIQATAPPLAPITTPMVSALEDLASLALTLIAILAAWVLLVLVALLGIWGWRRVRRARMGSV